MKIKGFKGFDLPSFPKRKKEKIYGEKKSYSDSSFEKRFDRHSRKISRQANRMIIYSIVEMTWHVGKLVLIVFLIWKGYQFVTSPDFDGKLAEISTEIEESELEEDLESAGNWIKQNLEELNSSEMDRFRFKITYIENLQTYTIYGDSVDVKSKTEAEVFIDGIGTKLFADRISVESNVKFKDPSKKVE